METGFAAPVEFVHTLSGGLFSFVNSFTGKVDFGDGAAAVAAGADAHRMLLGEDAIELSQGSTSCTGDYQAQNRIKGSLPVPPSPVDPRRRPLRGSVLRTSASRRIGPLFWAEKNSPAQD